MVSRLIEQKGIHYGLRGFARIAADFPRAHLLIIGDGALRGALEAEVAQLGIAPQTHFLGWRADAPDLMQGIDVFLMPSLWEGFGLTLLEAMNAALPIIGSRVGAIPEVVVDGETGYLVGPRDSDAIAAALATLLADAPLRHHCGLLGQDRLETNFSSDKTVDNTLAVYARLIRPRSS
jgi:glycosyltransferase involved in cell wall biosynthesis